MLKICTKCEREQPLENFCASKNTKDGKHPWCRECFQVWGKARSFPVSVEHKVCGKCGEVKPQNEFPRSRRIKDGLSRECKDCGKQRYQDNRESLLAQSTQYHLDHPEVGKKAKKKHYENNKEKIIARSAAYYSEHKEEISAAKKADGAYKEKRRLKRLENIEESLAKEKKIRDRQKATRPEEIKEVGNRWYHRKIKEDVNFKLSTRLRSRLHKAITRGQRAGSAIRDMGCSVPELKAHLEARFQDGMTWENWGHGRGKWNIDHIMPLAVFDLTDRQHVLLSCHYLNLQPMWHTQNMKKGKKLLPEIGEWGLGG